MKRTPFINLAHWRKADKTFAVKPVAMGIMAATLSACDDAQVANIYSSVMECATENPDYVELCELAYQQALQEAAETAPKYSGEDDCENDFGINNCMTYTGSSQSWFMPAMAGFLFAQLLDDDLDIDFKKKKKRRASPLFMSKNRRSPVFGNWVSATGQSYGAFNTRKVKVSSQAFQPKPRTVTTTKRGGFGAMARATSSRSSWGS
jgi:uncharacterized protein YgiB involved in biofilm formation